MTPLLVLTATLALGLSVLLAVRVVASAIDAIHAREVEHRDRRLNAGDVAGLEQRMVECEAQAAAAVEGLASAERLVKKHGLGEGLGRGRR